jgi:selenocysteine-specific elongation factor
MKSVIVGTAGHIDHGKTALVKALTGIDADRLEEEKRRGITIDIGFAHLELPTPTGEKLRIGFVDVPGHERFVRNMLAGIGGIDLVLLVIAADESIKPQTREHFDICRLLSVRRGITVLTKSDLVDRETLDVVRMEIEDFVRGSFLENSQTIAVSSLTGAGIDDLKQALSGTASQLPARNSNAIARLPIDRVFTMKGFGTVVTGTLISGTIRKDDELVVLPGGHRLRVRGVQVHGAPADQAVAGQRTALNLVGATTEDLSRGMSLAPPDTFQPGSALDVELTLLPSAKPVKEGTRLHFHSYTSETLARVRLLGQKQLLPGQSGLAHLRLIQPTLLLPGDRFIVRQFSPVITVGGGVVLDASPPAKVKPEARENFLKVTATRDPARILMARIARRGYAGLPLKNAVAETGWRPAALDAYLKETLAQGKVLRIGDRFVDASAISSLTQLLPAAVAKFHLQNPLAPGISRETLREQLEVDLSPEVFGAVLDILIREKKLEIDGEFVRAAGRAKVAMKDEELESKRTIETAFASAGLKVPALKDVVAGLKVDKTRAQKLITLLLRDKILIKISDELVFHQNALAGLRQRITAEKSKFPKIDVARFKDLTGLSRKYAIPLLEYLDREHVTRRVGDERIIL